MNYRRSYHSCVIHEHKIIALGGMGVGGGIPSVESYCFHSKSWTLINPLSADRWGHCACIFDDKIYVIGGFKSDSVEVYNPYTLQTKIKADLQLPRDCSAVVQI